MIVDFHRKPLDSKVLYHNGSRPSASSSVSTTTTAATNSMFSTTIVNHVNPTGGDGGGCGCFFNLETIHAIFSDVPETSINDSIINTLQVRKRKWRRREREEAKVLGKEKEYKEGFYEAPKEEGWLISLQAKTMPILQRENDWPSSMFSAFSGSFG